jgi:nucleoside phosphorylase
MSATRQHQPVLVCFAVKHEARFFNPARSGYPPIVTLITGMGRQNASRTVEQSLTRVSPRLVLTCGFAGGLKPGLPAGSLVYSIDDDLQMAQDLDAFGAIPVRFHCGMQVVATAAEKRALRAATHADAVEMESGVIRELASARRIPSATIRVISDAADEDLPFDFNKLMTPAQDLSYIRLARAIFSAPRAIPGLLRLQRQTTTAARHLARGLQWLLEREADRSGRFR